MSQIFLQKFGQPNEYLTRLKKNTTDYNELLLFFYKAFSSFLNGQNTQESNVFMLSFLFGTMTGFTCTGGEMCGSVLKLAKLQTTSGQRLLHLAPPFLLHDYEPVARQAFRSGAI